VQAGKLDLRYRPRCGHSALKYDSGCVSSRPQPDRFRQRNHHLGGHAEIAQRYSASSQISPDLAIALPEPLVIPAVDQRRKAAKFSQPFGGNFWRIIQKLICPLSCWKYRPVAARCSHGLACNAGRASYAINPSVQRREGFSFLAASFRKST
jgi:hypothetical protein